MLNPAKLDKAFEDFVANLSKFNRDGIITVDLALLRDLELLNFPEEDTSCNLQQYPFYFHVLEEESKVTLFNHQFVVWIAPEHKEGISTTYVLVALINEDNPNLELIFSVSGIYNNPKYILRVLRHYLQEIIDTEEKLAALFIDDTNLPFA